MQKTLSLVGIRFIFLLCVLFIFCFNNGGLPFLYYLTKFTTPWLQSFVPWFADKFLKLPYTITEFSNGSGDTTYDYVLLLFVVLTSIAGTLIWSIFDRKRKSHDQLFYWLTVVIRFYVGFMLIHYGVAKLNDGQFPAPGMGRLTGTYGDSSPMGLAWTFLGYSEGYKWFMFFAEMMGVLLLFRKTATLGALLCLMTSANIMAVNYCFDVPVKILSTALVTLCIIFLIPNFIRLFDLFFKNKAVSFYEWKAPHFPKRWMRITKLALKYAAIALYAGVPLVMALNKAWFQKKESPSPLYGAYDISWLRWDQEIAPTDGTFYHQKWKFIAFDDYDYGFISYHDGEKVWFSYKTDTIKKTVKISFVEDKERHYQLSYQLYSDKGLRLKGKLFGRPVMIETEKKRFELMDRGFRWINERPHNQ
ncbi:hypothetical protein [Pedobacter sp. GR22-6]|uniref:hypothetical protein n=1 Tax=Pedobacter sp. GR22-6 TaxID=3127957 RepID=UPI00307E7E1C